MINHLDVKKLKPNLKEYLSRWGENMQILAAAATAAAMVVATVMFMAMFLFMFMRMVTFIITTTCLIRI
ncbi:MAG: hypothetical protein ACHQUC_03805 [Chlamydiales bacterium]